MQNDLRRPVITVSELLRSVRDTLERRFPLLWVKGELSNLNYAASGHCYFTLKDRGAQVDCVMYRSRAQAFDASLREGMQVEAQVLVSLYEPRGRFQLTVENLRNAMSCCSCAAAARSRISGPSTKSAWLAPSAPRVSRSWSALATRPISPSP